MSSVRINPLLIFPYVGMAMTAADLYSRVSYYARSYLAPTGNGGGEPVPTPSIPVVNLPKNEFEALMNATALSEKKPEDFSLSEMQALLSSVKENITESDAWKEAAAGVQTVWQAAYEGLAGAATGVDRGIGEGLPPIISDGWRLTSSTLKIGGGLLLGFILVCMWRSTRPVAVKQNVTVLSEAAKFNPYRYRNA